MQRLFVLVVALTGCASARTSNPGEDPDAPNTPGIDAPDDPDIDASTPIDAPVTVNLVQTGSQTVTPTAIACQNGSGFHFENNYYRIFPLAESGITVPFHIVDVTFSVERATAGNGVSQPAQLKLGTFSGTVDANTFPVSQLQVLASATLSIPHNTTTPITTPISAFTPSSLTIPPGSKLYAQLLTPDGTAAGNTFIIGSNAGTETHASYIQGPPCGSTIPTRYSVEIPSPVIRILLSVRGTRFRARRPKPGRSSTIPATDDDLTAVGSA